MTIETGPLQTLKGTILSFLQRKQKNTVLGGVKITSDTESDEITNPSKTLNGLKEKADIMDGMMERNEVEQPFIGRIRWLVRLYFRNVFSDGGIEGLENLQWAISRARTTGKRLIFTPAHLADADHPAAIYLMAQKSRGLGIEDELIWMAGVNMQRRDKTKKLMRAEHVIYNVTHRDKNHLNTLMDKQDEYGFGEERVKTLGGIKKTFKLMGIKAMRKVKELCVEKKRPLEVYVEGGRSYEGDLKPPIEDFSAFFPEDDSAIVVPYRVYGSREFDPPGKNKKGLLRRELLPLLRQRVSMRVGESYFSSEIWEVKRRREAEEEGVNSMDWVMANIASLDWKYVRPEKRPFYESFMDRFAPGRNRNFHSQDQVA